MGTRTPLTLMALLLAVALTVLTPLSAATEATPTTATKKKKCKKGFVKKTVKKTVTKKGKKRTVRVKKCVKPKKAPAKKPVSTPAPPAPTPPSPPTLTGTYTGTTSQGQAITVNKSNQGSISVRAIVVVNCTAAPAGDASYELTGSAIGRPQDGDFQVSDLASAPSRPPLRIRVQGTIANGAAKGTIDPGDNAQCPDAGTPITFQATKTG